MKETKNLFKPLKVDKSKFTIEHAYWFWGGPYDVPGYRLYIKQEGVKGLNEVLVCSNNQKPNWKWVVEPVPRGLKTELKRLENASKKYRNNA